MVSDELAEHRCQSTDYVEGVLRLPTSFRRDDEQVSHGYAVRFQGPRFDSGWIYFHDLEPALVCGRSGRMAADVTGYGVVPAALRVTYDPVLQRDLRWLSLKLRARLDRTGDERQVFRRWLNGVRPASSHWAPSGAERSGR